MGLLSWYTMPTTVSMATAEYVTEGVDRTGVSGMFVASSQSIPAKNLGDTLYFAVYAKLPNGSYVYSAVYSYSAVEYAKDRLANSTNDSMKALCVALLNYGAQAQNYFDYRTDSLMNAELTPEQQALVKSYEASMVKDLVSVSTQKQGELVYNNGYSYRGPSVTMGGAFSINCYFAPSKPMDGDMKLYYWDMETYSSVETLRLENATGYVTMTKQSGSANYLGTYEGIAAKELDETVFLCGVYESNGVSYYTGVLPYSVGAYCVDRIQNGTAKMQTLAQAMAVYGYYAKEYFGA